MKTGLNALGAGVAVEVLGFYAWFLASSLLELPFYFLFRKAGAVHLPEDSRYLGAVVLAQIFATFCGGVVAGRIAKSNYVILGLAIGLAGAAVAWLNYPALPWWAVEMVVLALPAGVGGAFVARLARKPDSDLP